MIDCHIHFDERLVSAEGMIASMDAFGIERAALIAPMTPDLTETPMMRYGGGVMRRALNSRSRVLRRLMRRLYNSWVLDDGRVDVGGKQYPVDAQPDNDPILRVVAAHPERFVGWIFVNPAGPTDPVAEIERCLKTPGMIGVKAHPFWHNSPIAALSDAAALCQERGIPVLIHLGTDQRGDFQALPRRFPRLKILYAHAGIPYQRAVCDFARTCKNVYVDLSSPGYVDRAIAAEAIRRAGAGKCLFGSDGPYFHHSGDRVDYGVNLSMLAELGLAERERQRVCHQNFLELTANGAGHG